MTEQREGLPVAAPVRPSDAERERTIAVLREGVVQGRLSHESFVRRVDLALSCRARPDLDRLVIDVRPERLPSRLMVGAVARISVFWSRLHRTWRAGTRTAQVIEPMPRLRLPTPGLVPLRIGRSEANGLRLHDEMVSRSHAVLSYEEESGWVLCDLGSMNGTYVNGVRVAGRTVVKSADLVAFGRITFRLAA